MLTDHRGTDRSDGRSCPDKTDDARNDDRIGTLVPPTTGRRTLMICARNDQNEDETKLVKPFTS
jgi:hypothetical protein